MSCCKICTWRPDEMIYDEIILGEIKKRIEEVEAELNEKRLKSAVKNFREKTENIFALPHVSFISKT